MIGILSPREAAWEFSFDPVGAVVVQGKGKTPAGRHAYLAMLWAAHHAKMLEESALRTRARAALKAETLVRARTAFHALEAAHQDGVRAAAVETVLLAEL